jgi:hypothetical protein
MIITSSAAAILRYYFTGQLGHIRNAEREFYQSLLEETDDGIFCDSVRNRWPKENDNSVVGWTVGTRRFDRSHDVARWLITEVDVDQVYSKGIDDSVNNLLKQTKWNLKLLGEMIKDKPDAAALHRFHLDQVPSSDFHIIGIEHDDPGFIGRIELLDGSHRLVALSVQGTPMVKAYIAQLKRSF